MIQNLRSQQNVQQTTVEMPSSGGGIDPETLRAILERLANLENELNNFKNEFGRWVKEL